jgi:hypothetical protein
MEGVPQIACIVCKKSGHTESNCSELREPLNPGFYSGGGGGGDHSHEDDEKLLFQRIFVGFTSIIFSIRV